MRQETNKMSRSPHHPNARGARALNGGGGGGDDPNAYSGGLLYGGSPRGNACARAASTLAPP